MGGGFVLARPAEKIGLGEIVRLGEETATVIHCDDREQYPCRLLPCCRLKGVLGDSIFGIGVVVLGWFVLGIKTGWSLTERPDEVAEQFPESVAGESLPG